MISRSASKLIYLFEKSHQKGTYIPLDINLFKEETSKVISQIEFETDKNNALYRKLYPHTNNCLKIGITGPPGAGKSTLTDQLINKYLSDNKSVGVVAIDPSSPFSGGALLGDRVRMNNYLWNENVFIRSMGSQGNLGGLNNKAQDVGDVLAASGKEIIIYELPYLKSEVQSLMMWLKDNPIC